MHISSFYRHLVRICFTNCIALIAVFLLTNNAQAQQTEKEAFFQKYTLPIQNTATYKIEFEDTFDAFAIKSNQLKNLHLVLRGSDGKKYAIGTDNEDSVSPLFFSSPDNVLFLESFSSPLEKHEIEFHLFNSAIEKPVLVSTNGTSENGINIYSRAEWGADENIRFLTEEQLLEIENQDNSSEEEESNPGACASLIEQFPDEYIYSKTISNIGGRTLRWPQQYSPQIKKIVLHHTASNNEGDERDAISKMRATYLYHTLSRGWGDIGYHYVIGPNGEIFEGRAGGDYVVGAHALCSNIGSVGIALMGNFQTEIPNKEQIAASVNLVNYLAQKYGIDTQKSSVFHGQLLPNVIGHKDVRATACPGQFFYNVISFIRKKSIGDISNTLDTPLTKEYDAELVGKAPSLNVRPFEETSVVYSFKNTGSKTWNKDTWLHVYGNSQPHLEVKSIAADKNYVAADLVETSVAPGSIGTFKVNFVAGYGSVKSELLNSFEFTPIFDGQYKGSNSKVVQVATIKQPRLGYLVVENKKPETRLVAGEHIDAYLRLKNTGNVPWFRDGPNPIVIGTTHAKDRISPFHPHGGNRLAALKETVVQPGEIGTFEFAMRAPDTAGNYTERFSPVIEGIGWLDTKTLSFETSVELPQRSVLTKLSETSANLLPGESKQVTLTAQNNGDVKWEAGKMKYTVSHDNKIDIFYNGIESKTDELIIPQEVLPSQSFEIQFTAQSNGSARGFSNISFQPSYIGSDKRIGPRVFTQFSIQKPFLRAESQVPVTDRMITAKQGETQTIRASFKNTGNYAWERDGQFAAYLEPELVTAGQAIEIKAPIRLNETSVQPGETGSFTIALTPKEFGLYQANFSLHLENLAKVNHETLTFSIRSLKNTTLAGNVKGVQTNRIFIPPIRITIPSEPIFFIDPANPKKRVSISAPSVNESLVETPITTQAEEPELNLTPQDKSSPRIRIRLGFEGDIATIGGNGEIDMLSLEGDYLTTITKGDAIKVTQNGNVVDSFIAKKQQGFRFVSKDATNTILEVTNWQNRPQWNPELNDNRFRDTLELRVVDNKLVVINELPLEAYMKGLAEVPNGEPFEKQKTMAVIARSYAYHYLDESNRKFVGKPYDGSDDPNEFQKYLGYGYEIRSPNFLQAVSETGGQVVSYQGKVIKTPYFNQSDGRTRSAEEVWDWKDTPYLISVEDPCCNGAELRGHGVGLSGAGATFMANQGKGYEEIIRYYYQGVNVEKVY